MIYPDPIQEIFRKAVTKCQGYVLGTIQEKNAEIEGIHYTYDTFNGMRARLENMKEDDSIKLRFPLVWLSESPPIPQVKNTNGFFTDVTLQVWVMFHTTQNWSSETREVEVFKPILRPIYQGLMKAISNMTEFRRIPESNLEYSIYEHKFLGTNDNTASMLTAFVDAIEIRDLRLTMNNKNCITELFQN